MHSEGEGNEVGGPAFKNNGQELFGVIYLVMPNSEIEVCLLSPFFRFLKQAQTSKDIVILTLNAFLPEP